MAEWLWLLDFFLLGYKLKFEAGILTISKTTVAVTRYWRLIFSSMFDRYFVEIVTESKITSKIEVKRSSSIYNLRKPEMHNKAQCKG